jgi:outer membrane protein TolC
MRHLASDEPVVLANAGPRRSSRRRVPRPDLSRPRNRRAALGAVVALALGACVPSRAAVFDPVAREVAARIGQRPTWTGGAVDAAALEALIATPLTADRAAAVALIGNAGLAADFDQLGVAAADVAAATAPRDPEVGAQLRFPTSTGEAQLEFSALLDLRGLVLAPARHAAASAALDAARQRAARAAIDLAARARADFIRAIAADAAAGLARDAASADDAGAALGDALRAAGNVTALDQARAQAAHEDALDRVATAEAAARAARARLDTTLGLDADVAARVRLDRDLPDPPTTAPDTAALDADALARSLELDELRAARAGADRAAGVARWETFTPGVAAGASAKREAGAWTVGPAIGLSLPLATGSATRARADAEVRILAHRALAATAATRTATRAARDALASAHARVRHLHDVVLPLRATIVREAVRQYNAMTLTPYDLIGVRKDELASRAEYTAAVRDYWLAQIRVDQLAAGGTAVIPGDQP